MNREDTTITIFCIVLILIFLGSFGLSIWNIHKITQIQKYLENPFFKMMVTVPLSDGTTQHLVPSRLIPVPLTNPTEFKISYITIEGLQRRSINLILKKSREEDAKYKSERKTP